MKLKQIRENVGMTQEQLSEATHLSINMIQSLESGRRNGSTKTVIQLASTLGVTTDVLLFGCDNTNSTDLNKQNA
ncbi:prophage P2a protein 10 phage Cro-CI family transcriptional regulator [Furfurilactobacillus rossiae]|uniref:helix-turn-helix domain-containing protein n=1 Tax=Furfurilactobacillus rossiae TaxID=231049 RepID=UPI0015B7E9E7|nr:helix-turn-helix transcriptional regulator [Furfurilactobacillus rossiae]QLE63980.1 prophage P2a protein 10 phage Cro-CI family transcriptional regulator [Furfurilactobacillus rossiae]